MGLFSFKYYFNNIYEENKSANRSRRSLTENLLSYLHNNRLKNGNCTEGKY